MQRLIMLVFLPVTFFIQSAFSQPDSTVPAWTERLSVQYAQHRGHVSKNYDTEFPLSGSICHQISILRVTDGSRQWHRHYRYPLSGIGMSYMRFGNDSVLGSAIGIFPQWVMEGRKDKRLTYSFSLGAGLAFFTRFYDRKTNPENELIGSRITNITTIGFHLNYQVTSHWQAFAGASLFHYSNGHTAIPNMGLNDHPYSFGFAYRPLTVPRQPSVAEEPADRRIRFNIRFGRGMQEMAGSTFPVKGPSYPVYNLALFASKLVSDVNNLHLGMYATYYSGYYDFMLLEQIYQGEERRRSFVYSAFGGHEFLIGHFGFTQELVVNLHNPFYRELYYRRYYEQETFPQNLPLYLGLRLQFDYYPFKAATVRKNNLYVGANLKTIVSKADYVELHIGCSL